MTGILVLSLVFKVTVITALALITVRMARRSRERTGDIWMAEWKER